MIRSLWVGLNLIVSTVLIGLLVIVCALLRVKGRIYDFASRAWARWLLWASGTPVYVEGLENVRLDEPQVFVSNHVSWYDVFALAAKIPKRYRFVAKKELERIPLFGTAWKVAGHVSVDRGDRASAIRSLDQAGRLIREDNSSVVIFPEGTRGTGGELLPFKKGAFMLALHNGVDLVPVGVLGTQRILPKRGLRIRSGPILVRFGEPISTAGYDESTRDALMAEVRARIDELRSRPDPRLERG
ncbi:MAG: 1-acyl-sn-glycerol-3-phosphate acyltransferase [Gemmatimonadetes bacterium]|nr:1-acyl-sn-glycerol-3-phosphate acyltransferase [Gemmatimonadota bacterium]